MKRLLLFAALIAWSGMASAVVYKWIDAQGKLQYGDRPPDGVHAEVVELLGTHAARARRGAEASAAAALVARMSSPRTAATARKTTPAEESRGRATSRRRATNNAPMRRIATRN